MSFDPEQELNLEFDGGFSTEEFPVPAGEYLAICTSVNLRQFTIDDELRTTLNVCWEIPGSEPVEETGQPLSQETGLEQNPVWQTVWLDRAENGALLRGKGKNVQFGKLMDAVGLNEPNQKYSFQMIKGQTARVRVKQGIIKSGAREGEIRAEVKDVSPA